MQSKLSITLYGTAYCHLCEEAELILQRVGEILPIEISKLDIAEQQEHFAKYHTSIPVIVIESSQQHLYWPFSTEDVYHFLANNK